MLKLIERLFIDKTAPESVQRTRYGNIAGVIGIAVNLLLCGFKLAVGLLAGSVAIVGDAINNLFDAASSIIALITFKIIAKPADEAHPFGHARFEYISSSIIAMLILYVAISLFRESADKILRPEAVILDSVQYVILGASILIKFALHRLYKHIGGRIDSELILANATDALTDILATSAILLSVALAPLLNFPLDGPMGLVVSVIIAKQGWDILMSTYNHLMGSTPLRKDVDYLRDKLLSYEGVLGIHDMIIHEYGPNQLFVTVHVEVDAHRDVLESHDMIDRIERDIEAEGTRITVHMDPLVTDDPRTNHIRNQLIETIRSAYPDFSVHDFRIVDRLDSLNLIFDVLIPVDYPQDDRTVKRELIEYINSRYEQYNLVITVDRDYLESLE